MNDAEDRGKTGAMARHDKCFFCGGPWSYTTGRLYNGKTAACCFCVDALWSWMRDPEQPVTPGRDDEPESEPVFLAIVSGNVGADP